MPNKPTATMLLAKNGLLQKVERLGVKKNALLRLLALPLRSPDQWKSRMQMKLYELKRKRGHLTRLLLNTSRELEVLILWMQEGMRQALIPVPDVVRLATDLKALAGVLRPPVGVSPLSSLLGGLSHPPEGRPSQTSARDHRIWQLAYLFKKTSDAPHHDLVAEIMNVVYDQTLGIDQIKKAISRHPRERTFYPAALNRDAPPTATPTKVMERRSANLKGAILVGPLPSAKSTRRRIRRERTEKKPS